MRTKILVLSAIVGLCLGFASARILILGTWDLILWGVIGIIIGLSTRQGRESAGAGILYGFFLTLSFLFAGFGGTSDKLMGFTLLSLGLSIPGMLGGWIAVFIGSKFIKK